MNAPRIGIDATALPPDPVGAGTYILQLIRLLSQQQLGKDFQPEFAVFAQPHGWDLIGIQERPGFEWVSVPEMSPARRLLWEQTGFPRLVAASQVDLLHSLHYTRPLRLPCRSVVTFHDMTFFLFPRLHTRFKRLFFPWAIRFSARHADALIAVSESTRQDAIRLLGVPPDKITAVPLGVSPVFHPISDPVLLEPVRRRYSLPAQFLLFVGLVEPRKNLPMLLHAYRRLLDQGDAIPLVIVGRRGWQVQQVDDLVDRLNLRDKVQFAGYVPSQDLPMVYNLASGFVYPSLYEGFGLPPLEAMACGTPVITTAVSSMPEHVGVAGMLVPPGDEDALARAMHSLVCDPALQQRLKEIGPQRAADYTWERTARLTLEVYQRVLASQ